MVVCSCLFYLKRVERHREDLGDAQSWYIHTYVLTLTLHRCFIIQRFATVFSFRCVVVVVVVFARGNQSASTRPVRNRLGKRTHARSDDRQSIFIFVCLFV